MVMSQPHRLIGMSQAYIDFGGGVQKVVFDIRGSLERCKFLADQKYQKPI